MRKRTAHVLIAAVLAAGGAPALAGCGDDDVPDRNEIERGVDDATDDAGEALDETGDEAGEALDDAEDAVRDGE
jgi:hypothetical protein